jgi:hypothetical protein
VKQIDECRWACDTVRPVDSTAARLGRIEAIVRSMKIQMLSKPSLESLLRPKSIAIVGASPNARMGLAIIRNAVAVFIP